jgi:hypothetical protein
VQGESPAAFVDQVVMDRTQWQQVGQVGGAAVFPGLDVVDLTVLEPHRTSPDGASLATDPAWEIGRRRNKSATAPT